MAVITQLETLKQTFLGVMTVADTPLDIMGYLISPMDIWLTMAVIYMLVDIFLFYMWGEKDG